MKRKIILLFENYYNKKLYIVKLNVNIQHCIPNDYIANRGTNITWVKVRKMHTIYSSFCNNSLLLWVNKNNSVIDPRALKMHSISILLLLLSSKM